MTGPPRAGEPWLPDLCRLPRLATMFGGAELVVLVLALAPDGGAHWNLQRFISASGLNGFLAMNSADSRAVFMRSVPATTLLTSPHCRASSAA